VGILLDLMRSGDVRHRCPKCDGGATGEKSFAVFVPDEEGPNSLVGSCYRASCRYWYREYVGPGEVLEARKFEPRPLRQPYRL
jgi:hypothetical protein